MTRSTGSGALAPTQTCRLASSRQVIRTTGPRRILAPDGRYEHTPLSLTTIAPTDLDVLAEIAAIAAELIDYDERVELGPQVEQLHRLLTLPTDADVELLAGLVARTPPDRDLTLTTAAEAAYQRLADRFTAVWSGGPDPLHRFLY